MSAIDRRSAASDKMANGLMMAAGTRIALAGPVPQALIDYAYATAHQPGAHYTPLRFISGLLFTRNARQELYERLTLPVLVVYDRDTFSRFDTLPEVAAAHANWQTARIQPTLGLAQFEAMPQLAEALNGFWHSL